jgi:hypothetical protein
LVLNFFEMGLQLHDVTMTSLMPSLQWHPHPGSAARPARRADVVGAAG